MALITAHQELENCCLEREQHRIKRDIDKRWGELVYDAQWFSPATQSLNAFIEDTQKYVSGEIRMVLHGGRRRRDRPSFRLLAVRLQARHL